MKEIWSEKKFQVKTNASENIFNEYAGQRVCSKEQRNPQMLSSVKNQLEVFSDWLVSPQPNINLYFWNIVANAFWTNWMSDCGE